MIEWLKSLTVAEGFMPHGMCYLWDASLINLHFYSDTLIALAYFAIPPALVYLVVKAREQTGSLNLPGPRGLPYDWMFLAFGIFIVACGATHVMAAWTIWKPYYWLSGGVKMITAIASVATAVALPPLIPKALKVFGDARASENRRVQLESAHTELEHLYERLKEFDALKNQFFANVSHELRTPISLVLGPIEKLLKREDFDESARRELEVIRRNALRLSTQVDDLLDLAHIESGVQKVTYSSWDLSRAVSLTAGHFENVALEKNISFTVETPPTLPAQFDREKLEKILFNLLSNAFKFTPADGSVRVSLSTADRKAEAAPEQGISQAARIEVADSGPGIPPQHREVIFERFQQIDGTATRKFEGTGLGLSIVKEFVMLHGGRISAGDSEMGGALFTVDLPVRPADEIDLETGHSWDESEETGHLNEIASALVPQKVPSKSLAAIIENRELPLVLVVEDNLEMNRHLVDLLKPSYQVISAYDGSEGLKKAMASRPDLIISDLMMPEMSGDQMVRELRLREDFRGIPVLALTAKADEHLRLEMLKEGVQDYVLKPFGAKELLLRVENLIILKRSRDLLQQQVKTGEEDLEKLIQALASQKEQREQVLQQKQTLLRELHHRVKGNLQTIASILKLQSRQLRHAAAKRALLDSVSRIQMIALIHEKLYASNNLAELNFQNFASTLVRYIMQSYQPGDQVNYELTGEEITLDVEVALPCGLILHELISNSLRHAFPDERQGQIQVRLTRQENLFILKVSDDGVGLPPGMDFEDPETAGLQLVTALTRQLHGQLKVHRNQGTAITVTFPQAA